MHADVDGATALYAEHAVAYDKLGTVMKYTGISQIHDSIFALFQKDGILDPATKPQLKVDHIVKLSDNSGAFVLSGEFESFRVPYDVANYVLDDNCKIIVETAIGVVIPIEK